VFLCASLQRIFCVLCYNVCSVCSASACVLRAPLQRVFCVLLQRIFCVLCFSVCSCVLLLMLRTRADPRLRHVFLIRNAPSHLRDTWVAYTSGSVGVGTSCTPTKSNIYLDSSPETVIREPALYKLLIFHVPNLKSIFLCLDPLPKKSV
jgi:hypothetical protein